MWTGLFVLATLAWGADSLETLQRRALETHPTLLAQKWQIQELEQRARVAGAWPDPYLTFEYSNAPVDSGALSEHPLSGIEVRVQQTTRAPGWSDAHRKAASSRAEVAARAVEESELVLRHAIARSWWRLVGIRRLIALVGSQRERVLGIRERLAGGGSPTAAELWLELEAARLEAELAALARSDAAEAAVLRAATGQDSFETPERLEASAPPEGAGWLGLAVANRPAFQQLLAEVEGAENRSRAASRDAIPGPSVWVGYRVRLTEPPVDTSTDFVSVGVGVPIPTGTARRGRAESAAESIAVERLRREREALVREVEAGSTRIHAEWSRAFERARTHADRLVPTALALVEATLAELAEGTAGTADLRAALEVVSDVERSELHAVLETHRARADAMALVGIDPGDV